MKQRISRPLTRAGVVDSVATRTGDLPLTKKQTQQALLHIFDCIAQALCDGKRVELRGFGVFSPKIYGPRRGINPNSGEPILLSHTYTVRFKAAKELHQRINRDFKRRRNIGGQAD
ncbi:MAG: integration host factor subunit beta [Gammaproteobacteria bacterium AqS3]|nr:integration host factor subunit beta [Gammaproteobacteria bacterium AqS3]